MKANASTTKGAVTPARASGAFFQPHAALRPAFFSTTSGTVQTALSVSQPGDAHEVEAEKMADHVMAVRETPFFQPAAGLQRQAAEPRSEEPRELDRAVEEEREPAGETEEKAQAFPHSARALVAPPLRASSARGGAAIARGSRPQVISPTIFRRADSFLSGGRAARIDPARARGPPSVSSDFENQLRGSKGGGRPLPGRTRVEMESSFGADFSGVRVHDGASADKLSRGIEARAFTHGQDIYFARNRYQPENQEGKHLLAHELTHVIQQGGGIREGVRRSPEMSRAPPSLQRIPTSMEEVRQEINGLAENIPGYSLGTVIIGHNPILGQNVAWSAPAFFRGAAGLIPGGGAIHDKLNEGGAIDDAFAWISAQIAARNLTWGRVSSLWDTAWDRMGIAEGISGNLAIFRGVFSGFFADVMGFIGAVVVRLTAILKELAITAVKALFGSEGPAYDMIAMVIGKDPLTDETRPWVTVDFLRAALNFFGFGSHVAKMDETGQLQNAADWLDQQFGVLSGALSGLIGGIGAIWDSLGLATLVNPLDVLTRTVGVVTGFVGKLLEFVTNLAAMILSLIKQVIISLARNHVHRIPGYRLFTVVIGLDPVTGEGVPRTAMNFVRGFLDFVPNGGEIYQNLEEGNALGRAMNWLGEQADHLGLTPGAIVQRFTDLWTSFSIDDLMNPLGAFERVAGVFSGFIGDVLTLAGRIALKLLEILFEVVMGGGGAQVLAILKEAQGTFKTIIKAPVAFVGNLVAAAKLGFTQFAGNILEHLRTGLLGWLFGALEGAGIQLPATFDLRGILSLAMQILGLTYAQIRPQLVGHLGEALVGHLEATFEVVRILLTEGLAGIWSRITEFLTVSLPEMVIGAIKNFVMERIVVAAVARIASMLNPAGAVVQAIIAIYNTVMFFIERMNQIMATAQAFVTSVSKIAAGNIGDAANAVEQTMARTLPVIISFLARLLGLGGISEKIREIVEKIRAPIRTALGRVIGWIVAQARRLGRGAVQAGTGNMTPQEKLDRGMELATAAVNRFRGRAVGEAVLTPLLAGIATRYDFQFLRVIPRDGRWVVSGKVNPEKDELTDVQTETAASPDELRTETQQAMAEEVGTGITEQQVGATVQRVRRRIVTTQVLHVNASPQRVFSITWQDAGGAVMPLGTIRPALRDAGVPTGRMESVALITLVGNHPVSNLDQLIGPRLDAARGSAGGRARVEGNEIHLFVYSQALDSGDPRTHAEPSIPYQFRPGEGEQAERNKILNHVETIQIRNFNLSTCSGCGPILAGFLRDICAAQAGNGNLRSADLFWGRLHGSGRGQTATPITWSTLRALMNAGWTLHAPASALPPETSSDIPAELRDEVASLPRGESGLITDQRIVTISGNLMCFPEPGPERERRGAERGGYSHRCHRPRNALDGVSLHGEVEFGRQLDASRGSGRPCEPAELAFFESRFGHDFSDVRIHDDALSADLAARLHALAFTRGRDIYFAKGRYAPSSAKGRRLLAHELTHVIQQGAAPSLTDYPQPETEMKIRNSIRRSARRVTRRAPDAPFFQAESPEAPFFTPAADVQKMAAGDKEQVDKAPAEEPAREPEEEIQAKTEEEETVMAKCECESGCGECGRMNG